MPKGWDNKKDGGQDRADAVKLKDGDKKRLHVLSDVPNNFRKVYHSVLKKTIILPDDHPRVSAESTRYVFAVYDFADGVVKPWYVSGKDKDQLKGYADGYGGSFKACDIQVERKGSKFEDTKYTITAWPTQFTEDLLQGQKMIDLDELTKPSPEAEIKTLLATKDPEAEEKQAKRLAEPAKPGQRDFLEDLIDKSKLSREIFVQMLGTVAAKPQDGKYIPDILNVGQASALIDMVKNYRQ